MGLISDASESAPGTAPVVLAGFCAFLNLYATQPVLPLLENTFHASHGQITLTIKAATAAVAISAPFMGQIADRVGRKRVIVASAALLGITTLLAATSSSLYILMFWRFLQGLVTPEIFAVTIAYVNDEWPVGRAASAVAAYVSGTVLGGFSGRVLAGFYRGDSEMALDLPRAGRRGRWRSRWCSPGGCRGSADSRRATMNGAFCIPLWAI
jgi:MFS family permease